MPDPSDAIEILLVEDNPTDAELCIRALTKHGVANTVKWVKDGAEALDYLFRTGAYADVVNDFPKIVLLDLRMPKVDGFEVLRKMRANERTRIIPVVVLTSSKEDIDAVDSYLSGANSFISKPVDFDAFVDVVAKLGYYWLAVNKSPV